MTPLSVPFISARWHGGHQEPKAVVIHGTVSPCVKGGARGVAKFFATHGQPTSAHYVVDPGETVQCVSDHTVAYHCGYNTGSIAFELCDPQSGSGKRWADTNHKQMLDRAARDVAQTCLAYGIAMRRPSTAELKARGPHGIYGHNDSRLAFGRTTHSDPGPDFPWTDFIAAVNRHAADMRDSHPIPPKESGMNNVEYGRSLILAGLAELAKAANRPVVRAQAVVIRAALAVMPKK